MGEVDRVKFFLFLILELNNTQNCLLAEGFSSSHLLPPAALVDIDRAIIINIIVVIAQISIFIQKSFIECVQGSIIFHRSMWVVAMFSDAI